MQNLTKYSNRHYFVPRKIVSTVNLNKNVKLTRLPIIGRYHILHGIYNRNTQLILQDCLTHHRNLLQLKSCTNFSTSSKHNEKENRKNKSPKENDDDRFKAGIIILLKCFIGGICTMYLLYKLPNKKGMPLDVYKDRMITWHEFIYELLAKGEVTEVTIYPNFKIVVAKLHEGAIFKQREHSSLETQNYFIHVPDVENIEEKIRKFEQNIGIQKGNEVSVVYDRSGGDIMPMLLILSSGLLLLRGLLMSFKHMEKFMFKLHDTKFTLVDPSNKSSKGVHFADVAGLKEAKTEIIEFVDYLKQPKLYQALGAKIPKGALLLGPPGCGKTLLAKAVATEANVPFLSMNGSEFIEIFGGLGAARVRDLFKEGRKRAPSIIYIDEIDAIGKKRSESMMGNINSESESTLNQLLVEMDGMTSRNNIIVLASTNRAEVLDKALLRPGRFDRHILIDLPTLEERKQIFEYHLEKIALQQEPSKYCGYLAHLTPGFTGADIANVCNEAALHAARYKKKKVDGSDLMYAIDRTIGGTKKINNTITPSMKRIIAYHEAGHALAGWLLKYTDALLKVTIVPRTNSTLGFAQYTKKDQKLYSKEELHDKMCMMLAGRAAESLIFNQITTGAQNDLEKVTQLAYLQIQQYGMCPAVGLIAFDPEATSTQNKKPYSKKLGNLMDAEARQLIAHAYLDAQKIINDNKDKLTILAEALLEKETLTYTDVEKLIGSPPYEKKQYIEPADFETFMPNVDLPNENSATT